MQTNLALPHRLSLHTNARQKAPPTLPKVSHDSNPPPRASPTMDPSSSTISHDSTSNWSIAHKKGIRSTHNPYPIYNFLSYHHLSPLYSSFVFSLYAPFLKLFMKHLIIMDDDKP